MRSRIIAAIAVCGVCLLAANCAMRKPTPPVPMKTRMAVFDFAPPNTGYHDPKRFTYKSREGWAFGSELVYNDANIGFCIADKVAQRLNRTELIQVDPRTNFRNYLASLADKTRKQYPHLKQDQIDTLLDGVVAEKALEIGSQLQVDHIICGQVLYERLAMNNTSKIWISKVRVRLMMWDVEKRNLMIDREFSASRWFASPQLTLEALADEIANYLKDNYGYY
ncbi:MAG: hypothetical protein NTX50_12935 [Candidatus Sumerlaeota bacterium]|nr:hypothetical protein [Candidatus Sumerlaeota bacterium]